MLFKLSLKLKILENNKGDKEEDDYLINKEDMDDILEDYKFFISQKSQMIETIRAVTKQLIDKMDIIQLPNLKKMFMNLGNLENDNGFKCTFCNTWSGKNKASLAAHMRNCKCNPKIKEGITNTSEQLIEVEVNIPEPKLEPINTVKKTSKKK